MGSHEDGAHMENQEGRPNIFSYATSELSQDAFLCWLLAWADSSRKATDPALHDLGTAFLRSLFGAAGKNGEFPTTPGKVVVKRQQQCKDVLATVGDHHVILIEDKVGALPHGDQLVRYASEMAIPGGFKDMSQILIYLKTDEPTPGELAQVKKVPGWFPFLRWQLLDLLRTGMGRVQNDIYRDFLDQLEEIDRQVLAFQKQPAAEWTGSEWKNRTWGGFFGELFKRLPGDVNRGDDWGYVPNQREGFMGLWWSFLPIKEGRIEIYLQMSYGRLEVRLKDPKEPDKIPRPVGEAWSRLVTEPEHWPEFKRPAKLKSGNSMAIAVANEPWLRCDHKGHALVAETAKYLAEVTARLKKLVESPDVHKEA